MDAAATPALRDYRDADATALNRIALTAFEPFAPHYADWPTLAAKIARLSELQDNGELVVAEHGAELVGGVAYIPPGQPKAAFFEPDWAVIRMLVVAPAARGQGIGRALAEDCLRRARRDAAATIALHSSPIMTVAVPMYERMGFARLRDAPPVYGVPCAVFTKTLRP